MHAYSSEDSWYKRYATLLSGADTGLFQGGQKSVYGKSVRKSFWPPSEIICVFVNSRAKRKNILPRSEKIPSGTDSDFFYKYQLLR